MNKGVEDTQEELNERLYALEETGPTALGPAVVSAIAMAGECGNGSQVFICTDGLSNIGVGCLEEQKESSNPQQDVITFYKQLADYAYSKGVTVNIISIKGEECDLETLSPLYDKTGGNVDVIEPDELKNNFSNILKQEIIATRVVTKIKLHKALEFRNEEDKDLNVERTLLTKDIGNVTEESEITFEYRLKLKEDLDQIEDFDIKKLSTIPFQTIIEYTKLDGMKCIRILTQVQKVTDKIDEAKKNTKIDVLAVNAAQQVSKLAKKGNFREAQAYGMNQKNYIKSNANSSSEKDIYKGWSNQMNEVYDDIHMQNNMEEMASEQVDSMREMKAPKKKGFFSRIGDKLSKNLRKQTQFNSNNFKK